MFWTYELYIVEYANESDKGKESQLRSEKTIIKSRADMCKEVAMPVIYKLQE